MNAMRVALPKTYHHPVRLGTGCSSAWRTQATRPLRSSSQPRNPLITLASRERNGARQNFHLPALDANRVAAERLRRRAGCDASVRVVDTPVAGAEKELGLREPPHRAPQVRAVHRERGEARLAL